jgi:hypothetical protein
MYQQQLSSQNPGLIMILLDQSGSMEYKYGESTKADFAALAVNRVISEIIQACTIGESVKDRCFVAAVGYSTRARPLFLQSASQLALNADVVKIPKRLSDGAGGFITVDQIMRVFVKPEAEGSTNMAQGFSFAREGITKFVSQFPNSFPPIVINITDGEPDDFDYATLEASKLGEVCTSDGNVTIMNAFISDTRDLQIQLPSSSNAFKTNQFAEFLYGISSILPEPMIAEAQNAGFNASSGSRGFIYNADPETLIRFLRFGTAIDSGIIQVKRNKRPE